MARTNAISLLAGASTPATLAEIYGRVIENVQKSTLSTTLKSQLYTGNPAAGSVEFKRFVNSASKAYGTARAAAKGDKVTAPPTTVNLNQHKEIVEEVAKFDLDTFGVAGVMQRRADNHVVSMSAELDRAFFAQAAADGTAFSPASGVTAIQEIVERLLQCRGLRPHQAKYRIPAGVCVFSVWRFYPAGHGGCNGGELWICLHHRRTGREPGGHCREYVPAARHAACEAVARQPAAAWGRRLEPHREHMPAAF